MQKRSPRFPSVPLEEALDALTKIDAALKSGARPNRPTFLEALGYRSEHGGATKLFAALRGYDLIDRKREGGEAKPGFRITDLGRDLLDNNSDDARLSKLRRSVLSPPMFRRIWRKARLFSETELVDLLLTRGFTEPGAKRAASIYRANSDLARLEELTLEPDHLPAGRNGPGQAGEREKGNRMVGRDMQQRRARVAAALERDQSVTAIAVPPAGQSGGPRQNALTLPLSTGRAVIPAGISPEEFKMLMDTLRMWRPRLVKNTKRQGQAKAKAAAKAKQE